MADNDKEQRLEELRMQLSKEEGRGRWEFKGDPDGFRDHKEIIADLKAEISRLGG